jgi:hypothetical protein
MTCLLLDDHRPGARMNSARHAFSQHELNLWSHHMNKLIHSQASRRDFIKTSAVSALGSMIAARISDGKMPPTVEDVQRSGGDLPPADFIALFDGRTWANWQHDPHLDGVWEIADGVIRLRTDEPPRVAGKDYNLSTSKKYKDFTLMLDWRLTGKPVVKPHQWLMDDGQFHTDAAGKVIMKDNLTWGDSGVYLRGARAAQINIWCQPCGSGEVGTKFKDTQATKEERMKTMPTVRADNGPGEWNRFIITLRGDRVDISLNGKDVIQGARVKDIPAEGPITLQNHKDAVEFRHIFIKEL